MGSKKLCKSCSGPLDEFPKETLRHPEFCPYCVDEKGKLKGYKEILDGMIAYIQEDHPEIAKEKQKDQAVKWLREGPIWGEVFRGIWIEESLESKRVLDLVKIEKTKVSEDKDPRTNHGFATWHCHYVRFFRTELEQVIKLLKKGLRKGKWYADFQGDRDHYIVFRSKIFRGKIGSKRLGQQVRALAEEIGLPEEQLPFE